MVQNIDISNQLHKEIDKIERERERERGGGGRTDRQTDRQTDR